MTRPAVVSIRKTLRGSLPLARRTGGRIPFEAIAADILGKKYELSLVICGDDLATRMNREYRNKTYKPNVLSFLLSKTEGEIFLNVRCAEREARRFDTTLQKRLALLFVHGCFHLKGLAHGRTMEASEQRVLSRFKLH
jgi:rRNA maturation RNase YbeY